MTPPPSDVLNAPGRKFTKAKALASKLGVCTKTIHRMANAGKFSRFVINQRTVLFDESEVFRFVETARISQGAESQRCA